MTVRECYLDVQQRLNKVSTNAGKNLPKWAFVNAFNRQQLLWAEDRVKVDETTLLRKDEINQLLKTTPVLGVNKAGNNFYECDLPEDYFHYKRSISIGECEINNIPVKEGNINTLLLDDNWKPSLEWGETLVTLVGKRLRIYVDNFSINGVMLVYYRFPINIGMIDGFNDVNGNPTTDIDPEFIGSSLIEILNMTAEQLAGDSFDQWNQQINSQQSQRHT